MCIVNVFGILTMPRQIKASPVTIKRHGVEILVPSHLITADGTIESRTAKLLTELTKENAIKLESQGIKLSVGL